MKDLIHRLESTILELGAEIYSLKHQIKETVSHNEKLVAGFKALQTLLDERGLVEEEEFALAVNMSEIDDKAAHMDADIQSFMDDAKKMAH